MKNRILPFVLSLLLCSLSFANESDVHSAFSPKLRNYLTNNPTALKVLTNAFSEAFAGKTFRLFYFYAEDESQPRAFHTYAEPSAVWISVRENQDVRDELITLLFEVINSKSEEKFRKIAREARMRSVKKSQFAKQVLRIEFDAVKATRDLLRTLDFSEKERADSYYYNRFDQCPDDFEAFLAYSKKVSPKRDALKEYEAKYDSLGN